MNDDACQGTICSCSQEVTPCSGQACSSHTVMIDACPDCLQKKLRKFSFTEVVPQTTAEKHQARKIDVIARTLCGAFKKATTNFPECSWSVDVLSQILETREGEALGFDMEQEKLLDDDWEERLRNKFLKLKETVMVTPLPPVAPLVAQICWEHLAERLDIPQEIAEGSGRGSDELAAAESVLERRKAIVLTIRDYCLERGKAAVSGPTGYWNAKAAISAAYPPFVRNELLGFDAEDSDLWAVRPATYHNQIAAAQRAWRRAGFAESTHPEAEEGDETVQSLADRMEDMDALKSDMEIRLNGR